MQKLVTCSALLGVLLIPRTVFGNCAEGPHHNELVEIVRQEFGESDASLFEYTCADRGVLSPPSDISTWAELRARLLTPEVYQTARRIYFKNLEEFRGAHERDDIPPEAILSITLVETLGGTNLGYSPVLTTLYNRYQYRNRGKALTEIRSFFKSRPWVGCKMPIFDLKGSSAGALGIPQFTPWAVEYLSVDGDGDKAVNLCEWPDTIASISHYLREHDYDPDDPEAAFYHYNHSRRYAAIAAELEDKIRPYLSPFSPPPTDLSRTFP